MSSGDAALQNFDRMQRGTDEDVFPNATKATDRADGHDHENVTPQDETESTPLNTADESFEIIDPQPTDTSLNLMNRIMGSLMPTLPPLTGRNWYLTIFKYCCWPPAVGMIIISLLEILFFCIDESFKRDSTKFASGPIATIFVYDPYRRREVWRYLTYVFVHIGVIHLAGNLIVQVVLGTPFEIVHNRWPVFLVYFSGALAGSLATSITDPSVKLAGASGGVFALITAHVVSIIMKWNDISFPLAHVFVFLLITCTNVIAWIYTRYVRNQDERISYVAHLAGAVAGLLVGMGVLMNPETRKEKYVRLVSILLFVGLMTIGIAWNVRTAHYPPERI